jgi:cell division transport system permease protein
MMPALRYAIAEAAASLWRGRRAGIFSVATIALALFVLGGFLLVSRNLQRLADDWRGAAEMSVFLSDDVSDDNRRHIEAVLAPGRVVAAFEYLTKADALIRFKQTFGDLASALDALDGNPLPASYEVQLQASATAPYAIEAVVAALRQSEGVSDVRYDRQWLDRLLSAATMVRRVGLLLASVLAMAAALTVATVVRLALHARRDEIEIMQLVGAPRVYVRGPFVMEGVFQGGIGAVAALGGLAAAYLTFRASYLLPLAAAINVSSVSFLSSGACLVLVGGGMLVGCLGGALATRTRT